jgi:HAD superfamily hydrolase (TIGR01549 family)
LKVVTKPSVDEKTATPAILFDLDGTLMDSNYEHIAAWREVFRTIGLDIPSARIHRFVGMSGQLMVRALFTELDRKISLRRIEHLEKVHKRNFEKKLPSIRMLPGARELLKDLSRRSVKWAIATGGDRETVERMIKPLHISAKAPVITGDHVEKAKPDPDVFLMAAQRLGVELTDCIVVGDSVWDILGARRAKAIGVGLLCGGYSAAELEQAGAYRVYRDPADLQVHLAEIGIQPD